MRLLSFHADGFGVLAQTGAEGLGPGINIFLGDNEAGKSTCLAFLRAMLTGYPSGRKERQAGQPLRPGRGQPDAGKRPPRPAASASPPRPGQRPPATHRP